MDIKKWILHPRINLDGSLHLHWLQICEFGPFLPNAGLIMQNITIFCKSNKIFGFYDNFTPKIQIFRKFHGKQRFLCFQISNDYIGSSL